MALPHALMGRIREIFQDDSDRIFSGFSVDRIGSFRINTLKGTQEEVEKECKEKGIIIHPSSMLPGVYEYNKVHEYTLKGTQIFYTGKIYLQSIASMLPVMVLNPQSGEHVLDVCAAPGSKTTQMAMFMHNTGSIIAIEQNQIRYDKLIHNCRLQGATIVTGNKMSAEKFLDNDTTLYDKILLDAPCSAEGRISLHKEKSYGFWKTEIIARNAELQRVLLEKAFARLRSGGILVYATCTLAPEENECIIDGLLKNQSEATLADIDLPIIRELYGYPALESWKGQVFSKEIQKTLRIIPSEKTEGFYIAKITKR